MRRQRMLGFPVLVTLALVVVHQVSSAQGTNAQQTPAPTVAGSPNPESATDHALSASEVLARMDSARGTVRRMLQDARGQRDVIMTLCLDDKLNQIDIALRNARDHKGAIDGAVKKNDTELAYRETTQLHVLRQRTEQLVAEANTCISKETDSETVGPVASTLSVDPTIAEEAAYYPPGIIIIEPPPNPSVIK